MKTRKGEPISKNRLKKILWSRAKGVSGVYQELLRKEGFGVAKVRDAGGRVKTEVADGIGDVLR